MASSLRFKSCSEIQQWVNTLQLRNVTRKEQHKIAAEFQKHKISGETLYGPIGRGGLDFGNDPLHLCEVLRRTVPSGVIIDIQAKFRRQSELEVMDQTKAVLEDAQAINKASAISLSEIGTRVNVRSITGVLNGSIITDRCDMQVFETLLAMLELTY